MHGRHPDAAPADEYVPVHSSRNRHVNDDVHARECVRGDVHAREYAPVYDCVRSVPVRSSRNLPVYDGVLLTYIFQPVP